MRTQAEIVMEMSRAGVRPAIIRQCTGLGRNVVAGLIYRERHRERMLAERLERAKLRERPVLLYPSHFNVRCDQEMREKLVGLADKQNCSVAEVLRTFVEWGFEELEKETTKCQDLS